MAKCSTGDWMPRYAEQLRAAKTWAAEQIQSKWNPISLPPATKQLPGRWGRNIRLPHRWIRSRILGPGSKMPTSAGPRFPAKAATPKSIDVAWPVGQQHVTSCHTKRSQQTVSSWMARFVWRKLRIYPNILPSNQQKYRQVSSIVKLTSEGCASFSLGSLASKHPTTLRKLRQTPTSYWIPLCKLQKVHGRPKPSLTHHECQEVAFVHGNFEKQRNGRKWREMRPSDKEARSWSTWSAKATKGYERHPAMFLQKPFNATCFC